jgi:hypothetical protein
LQSEKKSRKNKTHQTINSSIRSISDSLLKIAAN